MSVKRALFPASFRWPVFGLKLTSDIITVTAPLESGLTLELPSKAEETIVSIHFHFHLYIKRNKVVIYLKKEYILPTVFYMSGFAMYMFGRAFSMDFLGVIGVIIILLCIIWRYLNQGFHVSSVATYLIGMFCGLVALLALWSEEVSDRKLLFILVLTIVQCAICIWQRSKLVKKQSRMDKISVWISVVVMAIAVSANVVMFVFKKLPWLVNAYLITMVILPSALHIFNAKIIKTDE